MDYELLDQTNELDGMDGNKDENNTMEELYLVSFSRYPVELRDALQTGPLLAPVRAALRVREPQWKGAKLFCSVDQHEAVVEVAETSDEDVRPYHVLLTQSYRDALMKTIKRCPSRKGVRVKQEVLLGFVPVPSRPPSQAYAEWKNKERAKARQPEPAYDPELTAYSTTTSSGHASETTAYPTILEALQNTEPFHQGAPPGLQSPEPKRKGDGKKGFTRPRSSGDGKGQRSGDSNTSSDYSITDSITPDFPGARQVHDYDMAAMCVSSFLESAAAKNDPMEGALADKVADELEAIVRLHRERRELSQQQLIMSYLSMPQPGAVAQLPFGVPMPPHFGPVGPEPRLPWQP